MAQNAVSGATGHAVAERPAPLNELRRSLEARWDHQARVVNTCRAAGALVGLISFGGLPIWVLLFPPTMAATIRIIARWGWLSPAFNSEERRRGLRSVYVAAEFPLFLPGLQLLSILPAVLLLPLVALYARLKGGMSARAVGDLGGDAAVVASMVLLAFFYCFIQARVLRRFSGVRHRSLTARLVLLIFALIFIGLQLGHRIQWSFTGGFPLQPVWAAAAIWIADVLVLWQAGRVFGLWLTPEASGAGGTA